MQILLALWHDVVALDDLAPFRKVGFEEGPVGLRGIHWKRRRGERCNPFSKCVGPNDRADLTMQDSHHRCRQPGGRDEPVNVVGNDAGIALLAESLDLRKQFDWLLRSEGKSRGPLVPAERQGK